jgi:16S rRNA (cytosine1402-N4)-methyltransferase
VPISHRPVLVKEVLQFLQPARNQNFIDATLGGAGHAERILQLTGPEGRLLGLDWDIEAIKAARERLKAYTGRVILLNTSYTKIKQVVYDKKFFPIHGVLIDLGLSSDQLKDSGRGFSFQINEPLDMRFSVLGNELTAAEILNTWPEKRIKELLIKNSEERQAGRLAAAIVRQRREKAFETTMELISLIMKIVPRGKSKIHPATKTFQALRMEVNGELENIDAVLNDLIELLKPGSRIAVISFHSVEDRIVKDIFKRESLGCLCPPEIPVCRCRHIAKLKLITKKPIAPSDEEIAENFRSRSAKLRVVEKI